MCPSFLEPHLQWRPKYSFWRGTKSVRGPSPRSSNFWTQMYGDFGQSPECRQDNRIGRRHTKQGAGVSVSTSTDIVQEVKEPQCRKKMYTTGQVCIVSGTKNLFLLLTLIIILHVQCINFVSCNILWNLSILKGVGEKKCWNQQGR